jgi:hypothetical protein
MQAPNNSYTKFFARFQEIDTLPLKDWKPTPHLIAYFCKKYKETFDTDYEFKFNVPQASACYEVFIMNSVAMKISKKPETLKQYIDWVFKEKTNAKKRFRAISVLTDEELMQIFKTKVYNKVSEGYNRSTRLEDKYLSILTQHNINISTYGDLTFAYKSLELMPDNFKECFSKLIDDGLDVSIFDKVV